MSGVEWKVVSPDEMIRDIESFIKKSRENKYAFQVGLKVVDFNIDHDQLNVQGLSLPFSNIGQAELALKSGVITPTIFIEDDNSPHQVVVFNHRPVGYSGFMDCVTHSLALTNLGLFNVGRYPAVSLGSPNKVWQWFLHLRLATIDEVKQLLETEKMNPEEYVEHTYQNLNRG